MFEMKWCFGRLWIGAICLALVGAVVLPGCEGPATTGGDQITDGTDDAAGDDVTDDDGSSDPGDDASDGDADNIDDGEATDGDVLPEGKYAAFRLSSAAVAELRARSAGASRMLDGAAQEIAGFLEGADGDGVQLMFLDEEGGQAVADVDANGQFTVALDEGQNYHIVLLEDGRFGAPAIGEPAGPGPDADAGGLDLLLQINGPVVDVVGGPLEPVGEPLPVDGSDVPVGMGEGVELPGLTDAARPVEVSTSGLDPDRDGIPGLFDPDRDGDGTMDLADGEVLVDELVQDPPGGDGVSVSGAFVFNNLKLDVDELIPPPTSLFTHNDRAVVTIGWVENPAETPAGFAVQGVEVVDVPGWSRYGFVTAIADWTVAGGQAGYLGYPPAGSAWTGALHQESAGSALWQVWVQSPKADAALAAAYPQYVEAGKSVPLNWDLSGAGTPTSNKIDFYRLRITYSDGVNTVTRHAHASSHFSFRSPAIAMTVTTSVAVYTINPNDSGGDGHRANPIVWPDATTRGDIVIEALPPKFDVSSSAGIINGTLHWRFDVFYYDAAGQQIGSVLTPEIPITYSGGPSVTVTVLESILDRGGATDMDGDGVGDFVGAYTSSDVAAYKIDLTPLALTGSDNTGLFYYFVAESQAGSFAGF